LCGLRAEGASQTAYMIAVTGQANLGDDDFPSFDGYMRKPVTYDLLERVLEEWRDAADLDRSPPAELSRAPKHHRCVQSMSGLGYFRSRS
jgi:hypothetical protein